VLHQVRVVGQARDALAFGDRALGVDRARWLQAEVRADQREADALVGRLGLERGLELADRAVDIAAATQALRQREPRVDAHAR
jgi:hypothetical protein